MDTVGEDEGEIIELLTEYILVPSFLKSTKKKFVSSAITSKMVLELIDCYISDGGENTFHSIIDPDSEEILSELSGDSYTDMVYYMDDISNGESD
jgi:hypothetical protein